MYRAAVGLRQPSRPVGRQLGDRQLAGKLLTPVIPKALAAIAFQYAVLPADVVDIACRAHCRGLCAELCRIQQAEVVEHDVDGPEVNCDVMHRQDQHMLMRSAP